MIERGRERDGRLPDFVVAGAPRSGTSALHALLRRHPQAFVPHPKELHFFDTSKWRRGMDWYAGQFAEAPEGCVAGEITPHYLGQRKARMRLCAWLPDARLITVLRDPMARIHSHYHFRRARGSERFGLSDALDRERRGVQGAFPYVAHSAYAEQLAELDELGASNRLLLLWHEDLENDPIATLAKLAAHLGIAPFEVAKVPRVNGAERFRSRRVRRVSKGLPRPLRAVVGALNRVKTTYPPLDDEVYCRLRTELEPGVAALADRTGRDLSHWLAPPGQPSPAGS